MLLDATSPAPDRPPASPADRPARTDPQASNNPPSADNPSADSRPSATQQNGATQDTNCGKADAGKSKDGKAADGAEDSAGNDDATTADTATATSDQNTSDSTAVCAPAAPAQIVAGPAIAPIAIVTDAAPAQRETSPSDEAIAPAATSFVAQTQINQVADETAPPAELTSSKQCATENQPTGTASAKSNQTNTQDTPAALTGVAPDAAPVGNDGATKPADAPVTPDAETAAATPASSTEPVKKAVLTGPIEQVQPTETAALASETVLAKPVAKDSIDAGTPAPAASAQPKIKSQGDAKSAVADVAAANTNPAIVAANGNPTKDAKGDGAKSEDEPTNAPAHHASAEKISEPKTETIRFADSTLAIARNDNTQSPPPSLPTPQVLAASPAITSPALAATTAVAIPLAGVPVEIAAQAKNGNNRFEIRLDPPELGRIDVRLDIDRSGNVTSRLTVERPETLDLLRRDATQIERTLQNAGLKTSDQGLQFSLRDQSFAQRNDYELTATTRGVVLQDEFVPIQVQQNYGRLIGLGGGIDIRV